MLRAHSVLLGLVMLFAASARAENLNTARIEQITGPKGALNTNEGVFKGQDKEHFGDATLEATP